MTPSLPPWPWVLSPCLGTPEARTHVEWRSRSCRGGGRYTARLLRAAHSPVAAGLGEHLMAPRQIFGVRKGTGAQSLSLICDYMPVHTNRSLEATGGGYPHYPQVIRLRHNTLLGQDQAGVRWEEPSGVSRLLDKTTEPVVSRAKRCLLIHPIY